MVGEGCNPYIIRVSPKRPQGAQGGYNKEHVTENEFRAKVISLAHENNCLVYCVADSRTSQGDNGFPDLVIVGKSNVLFAELKSERGERSPDQTTWHYRLLSVGAYSTLWRPANMKRIESALKEL